LGWVDLDKRALLKFFLKLEIQLAFLIFDNFKLKAGYPFNKKHVAA